MNSCFGILYIFSSLVDSGCTLIAEDEIRGKPHYMERLHNISGQRILLSCSLIKGVRLSASRYNEYAYTYSSAMQRNR